MDWGGRGHVADGAGRARAPGAPGILLSRRQRVRPRAGASRARRGYPRDGQGLRRRRRSRARPAPPLHPSSRMRSGCPPFATALQPAAAARLPRASSTLSPKQRPAGRRAPCGESRNGPLVLLPGPSRPHGIQEGQPSASGACAEARRALREALRRLPRPATAPPRGRLSRPPFLRIHTVLS